jgi:hypothetical protein
LLADKSVTAHGNGVDAALIAFTAAQPNGSMWLQIVEVSAKRMLCSLIEERFFSYFSSLVSLNVTENLLLSQTVTVTPAIVQGNHFLSNFFLPSFSLGVEYPIAGTAGKINLRFEAAGSGTVATIHSTHITAVTVTGTIINPLVSAS